MAELFFESPVTVGVIGLAFVLIALITWINGGFKWALYTAIGLALLTILLVSISLQIETDREQIGSTLSEVAGAVQDNDLTKVLSFVHPGAVPAVMRVKSELPNYKFTEARITGVKSIKVDRRSNPPSAIAEFNVAVSVSAHGNQANGIRRFVRCYFLYHEGRWLVHDFEHFDVSAGFRDEPQ